MNRCKGYVVDHGGSLEDQTTPTEVLVQLMKAGSKAAKEELLERKSRDTLAASAMSGRQSALEVFAIRKVSVEVRDSLVLKRALAVLMQPHVAYSMCSNPWFRQCEIAAGIPDS